MSSRRSGRAKKAIDYAKFGLEGSDNDDDFQEKNTSANKRKKVESSPKSPKTKFSKVEVHSIRKDTITSDTKCVPSLKNGMCKERISVIDKVFQRQLIAAMEISKKDSLSTSNDNESCSEEKNSDCGGEKYSPSGDDSSDEEHLDSDENFSDEGDSNSEGHSGDEKHPVYANNSNLKKIANASAEKNSSDDGGFDKCSNTEGGKGLSTKATGGINHEVTKECDLIDGDSHRKKELNKREGKMKKHVINAQISVAKSPEFPEFKRHGKTIKKSSSTETPTLSPTNISCKVISSPVKLSAKGLRLGLSRKVGGKPLHSTIKVQL